VRQARNGDCSAAGAIGCLRIEVRVEGIRCVAQSGKPLRQKSQPGHQFLIAQGALPLHLGWYTNEGLSLHTKLGGGVPFPKVHTDIERQRSAYDECHNKTEQQRQIKQL